MTIGTGTEILYWGGHDGTNFLDTARMAVSTVWTGSELVVYGGYLNYPPYTTFDEVFVYTP